MNPTASPAGLQLKRIDSVPALEKCAPLLVEVYNAPPWHDAWTVEKALEKLVCFYNSPHFFGLMAVENGALVGCCVGNTEPYYTGDYFYLKEMFVAVGAQRTGVGSRLMAALQAHLATAGVRSVILFTSRTMFPYDFYQKHRFQLLEDLCMMHFDAPA